MGCMKCGRDLEEGAVFCESCLEVMGRYPVKPGTVVTLPSPQAHLPVRRTPRKRVLSPEEQLRKVRTKLRHLRIIAVILLVLCLVLGYFTATHFMKGEQIRPGQNYSAMESTEQTPE